MSSTLKGTHPNSGRHPALFGVLVLCCLIQSCTSVALKKSTVATGDTLTDLEYEMVLDNVALTRALPGALPWGLKLTQGSVALADTVTPSFNIMWSPTSRTAAIEGSRGWTESWTTVPVIDHDQVESLREVYKNAANADWIQSGIPTELGVPVGRYGTQIAWVRKADIGNLTDLVLTVFDRTKVLPGERAFQLPGPPVQVR